MFYKAVKANSVIASRGWLEGGKDSLIVKLAPPSTQRAAICEPRFYRRASFCGGLSAGRVPTEATIRIRATSPSVAALFRKSPWRLSIHPKLLLTANRNLVLPPFFLLTVLRSVCHLPKLKVLHRTLDLLVMKTSSDGANARVGIALQYPTGSPMNCCN